MKSRTLSPVFLDSIPANPEPGSLYISMQYETAVHLCACGCENKVVTPFGPKDWSITFDGTVSLRPSIGNGQLACRSHYYVHNNTIDWLRPISAKATQSATARDRAAHSQLPTPSVPTTWLQRAWDRIRGAQSNGRG